MNWKKSLLVVMILGITIFAMVGCSKTEEAATTTEQPASTSNVTRPAPPQGGLSANTSGNRPTTPAMDLASAAAKLGVTEQQLSEALGGSLQGPPDLATAATKLGISEKSLLEALGFPEGASPPSAEPGPASPGPAGQGQ